MATLIGTYDYFLYTNDKAFLSGIWDKYKKAMAFITAKIDSTGSLYVTGTDDWGRVGQGAHNTEAQMLMYRTLITASSLAIWRGEAALSKTWTGQAATIKKQINSAYWDASAGYVLYFPLFHVLQLQYSNISQPTETNIPQRLQKQRCRSNCLPSRR